MPNARYQFVNAVLLSIDSATVSGIEIAAPLGAEKNENRIVDYESIRLSTIETQEERGEVVEEAVDNAEELGVPLIVIAEEWTPHGISTGTFASLNVSWGKWAAELERAEVPKDHVIRVKPDPWRNALFGRHRARTRANLKKQAQDYVVQVLKRPLLQHDIAEAVCLRAWGCRTETAHQIVKRFV